MIGPSDDARRFRWTVLALGALLGWACGVPGGAPADDEGPVGGVGEGNAVAAKPGDLPTANFPFSDAPGPAAAGGAGPGVECGVDADCQAGMVCSDAKKCTPTETGGGQPSALCAGAPAIPTWTAPCNPGRCGACPEKGCDDTLVCRQDGTCGGCATDGDCGAARTCSSGYCVPKTMAQFDLQVAPDDWEALLDDPRAKIEYPCALIVDGVDYGSCIVRARGGSSLFYPKMSLRIELPDAVDGPGYARRINLRAEYNDRSMLRNLVAFEAFRSLASVPAPRARHVGLAVNGEPYGLMLEVERIGGSMLRRWGRVDSAPMYEADAPSELISQGAAAMLPLDADMYPQVYDKKSGTVGDYSDLRSLIEDTVWKDWLDGPDAGACRIRGAIDVGRVLDYLAVMALIQNHDHVRKNYYVSLQPRVGGTPLWEIYPWDLDLSMGCLWNDAEDNGYCGDPVTDASYFTGRLPEGEAPGYPATSFYNLMYHVIFSDTELRLAFADRVCAMTSSPFWSTDLELLIEGLATAIEPAVGADTRDRNDGLTEYWGDIANLQTFLINRTLFLRDELGCP